MRTGPSPALCCGEPAPVSAKSSQLPWLREHLGWFSEAPENSSVLRRHRIGKSQACSLGLAQTGHRSHGVEVEENGHLYVTASASFPRPLSGLCSAPSNAYDRLQ